MPQFEVVSAKSAFVNVRRALAQVRQLVSAVTSKQLRIMLCHFAAELSQISGYARG
jgi:hypothetical protein